MDESSVTFQSSVSGAGEFGPAIQNHHKIYSVAQCGKQQQLSNWVDFDPLFLFFRQKYYQSGHFPFKDSNRQKFQYYLGTIAKSGTYIRTDKY